MIHGRSCYEANRRDAHLSGGAPATRRPGRDHRSGRSFVRQALDRRAGANTGSVSTERRGGGYPWRRRSGLGRRFRENGFSRTPALARVLQEHRHGLCRNGAESKPESRVATPPLRTIPLLVVLLAAIASPALAQHADHGMREMSSDTVATAPTTPSRPVRDSALVADSLLKVCRPHVAHSIDAYSTCIGDGLASLSSTGNIALAMGTLDKIVHNDQSLVLLGHPLAPALGYAVRSTPATAT